MTDDRVVVYTGTRNLYSDMVVASKSLLYNDGADIVYFLIEDDTFPHNIPDCIHTMNVSNQTIFRHDGPNYNSHWTYMVLIRAALTKIFPQYDRLIHLDVDTIVQQPIDCLWNLDLSHYYYACVAENQITIRQHPYFNFGMAVHNLALLREHKIDDTIIQTINTTKLTFPEQDAINTVCRRNILELPQRYNAMYHNIPLIPDDQAVIKHFAARAKLFPNYEPYRTFSKMSWDQILDHQSKLKGGNKNDR